MRLRPLLLLLVLPAHSVAAQNPATQRPVVAVVAGSVRDSITHSPLAGAVVQLVAADSVVRSSRTAISDSLGRYSIADVPVGRYMLGFLHPVLDSLSIEPIVREVFVDNARAVRVDLATPSPARLRSAICGRSASGDSGSVIVGTVRGARDRVAVAGATVSAEWVEYSFSTGAMSRHVPRLVATTTENGWFAICNAPSIGTVVIMARRGADSTDFIEAQVPLDRFLRRELYIGAAKTVVATVAAGDSSSGPTRRRVGDGSLRGTVVTRAGGKPVSNARVGIPDGPETRVNSRGEWTLNGIPEGTRMLEVRAVGFYPEQTVVDVVGDAPPVRTTLATMQAVLDTVKVTASNIRNRQTGFDERRRAGMGRYITPEDVVRRNPLNASDLFLNVAGVKMERSPLGPPILTVRSNTDNACRPAVFVDGLNMGTLDPDDIDGFVSPEEIAGIEIYTGANVPAEFNTGLAGAGLSAEPCGSVVIWTRPRINKQKPESWKARLVGLGALAAVSFGAAWLIRR